MRGTRHEAFGKSFGDFVWCCRCELVHRRTLWEERDWYCPSPGCGANGVLAWPWEDIFPLCADAVELPLEGRRYSLAPPLARRIPRGSNAAPLWPDPQCRIRDAALRAGLPK